MLCNYNNSMLCLRSNVSYAIKTFLFDLLFVHYFSHINSITIRLSTDNLLYFALARQKKIKKIGDCNFHKMLIGNSLGHGNLADIELMLGN